MLALLLATARAADADGDGYDGLVDDCVDTDPAIHPGAVEICNRFDDDCDGSFDEGFATTWYTDADGDGWGDQEQFQPDITCTPDPDEVANRDDCDDADPAVHPGQVEICDPIDNDCDYVPNGGPPFVRLWEDLDGDTFGAGIPMDGCEAQDGNAGYYVNDPDPVFYSLDAVVTNGDDCNDFNANLGPGAREVCDGVDNDCNAVVDDSTDGDPYYEDADGDGVGAGEEQWGCEDPGPDWVRIDGDCDDSDPEITTDCDGSDEIPAAGDVPPRESRCGCGPGAGGSPLLALVALLLRRR